MDDFDDIYHTYDDDIDVHQDIDVDFDHFYTNYGKNDDEHETVDFQLDSIDEEKQLSESSSPVTKKLKTTEDIQFIEYNVPKYLSREQNLFDSYLSQMATNNIRDIEQLRQIAVLQHKISLIDIELSLWTTYLKSGTGKLKENKLEESLIAIENLLPTRMPFIWPTKLKETILNDINAHIREDMLTHQVYLKYVTEKINQFNKESSMFQNELEKRKDYFDESLIETIRTFLEEHNIGLYRIVIESQIVRINYDYNDYLFDRTFHNQQPYEDQVKIFKQLRKLKLQKEVSKLEVAILKQRLHYKRLSNLSRSLQILPPPHLSSLTDIRAKQSLSFRYEQLLRRTQTDLISLHIRTAEEKSKEYARHFQQDFDIFNTNQRTGTHYVKFTSEMVKIVTECFKNMNERLKLLFDLKVRFFVKAPTVGQQ